MPYANITLGNATVRPENSLCGADCGPRTINGTRWQYWGQLNSVTLAEPLLRSLHSLETQVSGYG